MKKITIWAAAVALAATAMSCKNDFDNDVEDILITAGDANFSKYVALGNSLTSGYRDNALYASAQQESYPNLMAMQMKAAGGGEFKLPLMPNETGGFANLGIAGKLMLQSANGALAPVPTKAGGDLDNVASGGPYQNMGVPGAKSYHLIAPGYGSAAGLASGTANPYFVRFATSPNASVLQDAIAQKPTFFSLWIGNNDVLSYASNGGTNPVSVNGQTYHAPATVQTGTDPKLYKANDISSPELVAGSIKIIIEGMKSAGAEKGVIANIPSITSTPFFTRVPYNAVNLSEAQATQMNNALLKNLKAALTAFGQGDRVNLAAAGANPVLIVDNALADLSAQLTAAFSQAGVPAAQAAMLGKVFGQARHAKSGELLTLTSSSVLGKDAMTNAAPTAGTQFIVGVTFPLGDNFSLTAKEIENVNKATAAYNAAISSLANQYGLALVDINSLMNRLNSQSGIVWNGVRYNAGFVTGGTFSLDGIHLTGKGYAMVANEFLKAINQKYRSNLPLVDANLYSGVEFP